MIYYNNPTMDCGGGVTKSQGAHFTCQELLNYIRSNINSQAKFFILPIRNDAYTGVWVPPTNYPNLTIHTLYLYDTYNSSKVCAFNFNNGNAPGTLGQRYIIRNGNIEGNGNAQLSVVTINGTRAYEMYNYASMGVTDYIFYTDIEGFNVVYNDDPVNPYELFRYVNTNSGRTLVKYVTTEQPIFNNENASLKFVNNNYTIINSAFCYNADVAGDSDNKKACSALFFNHSVTIYSYWSDNDGATWYQGSRSLYTISYSSGNYTTYGNNMGKFPNTNVIYSLNISSVKEFISSNIPVFTDRTEYMNYIQHPYVPYNWQSVLSIQGNDKTYLLSSIFNINNGNPVNNVSTQGNLSLASSTEVDTLISEVVLDMSKVKVTYDIPAGTYSYIKLVYKRGSAPTSVSDGTAINITQSSTSQVIDGIADGGTYWFVIFTDVSKSSAKSIQTQNVPTILWDIDRGIKHSMCSDFVSVKQNYDAYLWEFIDTYRLVGSGSNTPPGAGNTSITFQKGIKRKYATKMYIEIQCSRSYTLQWANSAMRLADTKTATGALPSGYLRVNFVSGNSGGVTDNYTHTTPYYTLPKMLIEIDISSVGADTMWYLAFWKCNEYTEITKCYFNAPVEIES